MFCIQAYDYEEGSAARWNEYPNSRFPSREDARKYLKELRNQLHDTECMLSFRVVEVGSDAYYSQPTDKLEY